METIGFSVLTNLRVTALTSVLCVWDEISFACQKIESLHLYVRRIENKSAQKQRARNMQNNSGRVFNGHYANLNFVFLFLLFFVLFRWLFECECCAQLIPLEATIALNAHTTRKKKRKQRKETVSNLVVTDVNNNNNNNNNWPTMSQCSHFLFVLLSFCEISSETSSTHNERLGEIIMTAANSCNSIELIQNNFLNLPWVFDWMGPAAMIGQRPSAISKTDRLAGGVSIRNWFNFTKFAKGANSNTMKTSNRVSHWRPSSHSLVWFACEVVNESINCESQDLLNSTYKHMFGNRQ